MSWSLVWRLRPLGHLTVGNIRPPSELLFRLTCILSQFHFAIFLSQLLIPFFILLPHYPALILNSQTKWTFRNRTYFIFREPKGTNTKLESLEVHWLGVHWFPWIGKVSNIHIQRKKIGSSSTQPHLHFSISFPEFRLKLLHHIQCLIQMLKCHLLPFPQGKRMRRPRCILNLSPINIPFCQRRNLLWRD